MYIFRFQIEKLKAIFKRSNSPDKNEKIIFSKEISDQNDLNGDITLVKVFYYIRLKKLALLIDNILNHVSFIFKKIENGICFIGSRFIRVIQLTPLNEITDNGINC